MAIFTSNQFVRSTTVRSKDLLALNGAVLWSEWSEIAAQIDALCGIGASRVFAVPTNVNRQPDGDTVTVAWFTSYNDEPRPLDTLDSSTRNRVHGDLTASLARLKPALADPRIGEAVGAILNIYDEKSIYSVGEHAVITNWGALPSSATNGQAAFARHSAATIGPFLSSGITPRIPGQNWTISGMMGAAGLSPPPLAKDAANKAGIADTTANASISKRIVGRTIGLWLLGGLAGLSLGGMIYVVWPGNLVYEKQAEITPESASERQTLAAGLQDRISVLKAELQKNACEVDRSLLGIPMTPDLRQSSAVSGAIQQDPTSNPTTGQTALDKIDAATVLVITRSGIGSGFFVNDTDILSNRHVVEGAGETVFVANKVFGKALKARVVAKSTDHDIGGADFALLRVEDAATGITPLQFTTAYKRNDNVLAGGFPFAILREDDIFKQVLAGNNNAVSSLQLVPTPGTIWLLPHGGSVQRITHSAEISPGNSGGPLVDPCGNTVGINTFIKTDGEILQKLNFAIASQDAVEFLRANGVDPVVIQTRCELQRPGPGDRS